MPSQSKLKGPEIFLGLVGAVGTDLSSIGQHLKDELHRVGYSADIIRLSELMLDTDRFAHLRQLTDGPEDERINQLMDAGDEFRDAAKRGDAVVLLALGRVSSIRAGLTGSSDVPARRQAYIFNSLKHPDEVTTLRNVYGQAFFVLCGYSPRETRALAISDRISRSRREYSVETYRSTAEVLIEKDEQEIGNPFGQNVRETFPEGDVFIDSTDILRERSITNALAIIIATSPKA
jgi:hypothetical protein